MLCYCHYTQFCLFFACPAVRRCSPEDERSRQHPSRTLIVIHLCPEERHRYFFCYSFPHRDPRKNREPLTNFFLFFFILILSVYLYHANSVSQLFVIRVFEIPEIKKKQQNPSLTSLCCSDIGKIWWETVLEISPLYVFWPLDGTILHTEPLFWSDCFNWFLMQIL